MTRGVVLSANRRARAFAPRSGQAEVDWSHPMSNNLKHLMLGKQDIATNFNSTATTAVAPASNTYGNGYTLAGSASSLRFPSPTNLVGGQMTAWVVVTRTGVGASSSYSWVMSKAVFSNPREFEFAVNSSGSLSYIELGGTFSIAAGGIMSDVLPVNSTRVITITRNSSNLITVYSNGIQKGTLTLTGVTAASTALDFGYSNSNSGYGAPGTYVTGGVATRCFNNSEVASLYADPFQMIKW